MPSRFSHNNPKSVNVFANPGEERINVMPNKSAQNRLKTKAEPAKSGDKTMPKMTAKVAQFDSAASADKKDGITPPGGYAGRIGTKLVLDFSASSKEAAMEKEAFWTTAGRTLLNIGKAGTKGYQRSRAAGNTIGTGLKRAVTSGAKSAPSTFRNVRAQQAVRSSQLGPQTLNQSRWQMAKDTLGGAFDGGWRGYGADVGLGFMTGEDYNFGTYGTLLGALSPAMRRAMRGRRMQGMMSGIKPAYRQQAATTAQNAWYGNPEAKGLLGRIGGRGALGTAGTYGMLGGVQQQLTQDDIPGGMNFARPAQTSADSMATAQHMLAQKLGLRDAAELDAILAMISSSGALA